MGARFIGRWVWLASCGSQIHRAMGLAGFLWEPDSSGDGFGCDPYRAINCAPTKPVPTAAIVGARFVGRWVLLRSLSRNKLRSHKTSSHGCNCGSPIHRAMGLVATLSRNKLRSHKTSSHKTSFHKTSSHKTSSHKTSSHQTSSHQTSSHQTSSHQTSSHQTSCHIIHHCAALIRTLKYHSHCAFQYG